MSEESDQTPWYEECKIVQGGLIESSKAVYVIDKKLGEGGFGAVFRVYEKSNKNQCYAMKVERKIPDRVHSKLKMELVANERRGEGERNHFTSIVDRGKKEQYFFLIMQLVGKSLHDLKKMRNPPVFSLGTGIAVSIQCLEAVEDLHKYGFLHRDLKPANYASGTGANIRTVYILDFGIARKYTNDKNELKTPRNQCRFKGTVKFASLNCHKKIEMSVKDDVESWFYLMLDIMVFLGENSMTKMKYS